MFFDPPISCAIMHFSYPPSERFPDGPAVLAAFVHSPSRSSTPWWLLPDDTEEERTNMDGFLTPTLPDDIIPPAMEVSCLWRVGESGQEIQVL